MEAEAQLGSPRGRGPQGPAPSCRPPSKAADGGVPTWPPGSLLGQQLRNPVLGQWSRQHVSAGGHPQVPGPEEQAILWDKWAASRCGMEVHVGPARVALATPRSHPAAAGWSPLALPLHHPSHPLLTRVAPTPPVTRVSMVQVPTAPGPCAECSPPQPLNGTATPYWPLLPAPILGLDSCAPARHAWPRPPTPALNTVSSGLSRATEPHAKSRTTA